MSWCDVTFESFLDQDLTGHIVIKLNALSGVNITSPSPSLSLARVCVRMHACIVVCPWHQMMAYRSSGSVACRHMIHLFFFSPPRRKGRAQHGWLELSPVSAIFSLASMTTAHALQAWLPRRCNACALLSFPLQRTTWFQLIWRAFLNFFSSSFVSLSFYLVRQFLVHRSDF